MNKNLTLLLIKTAFLIIPILFIGIMTLMIFLSIGQTVDIDVGLILVVPIILILLCWILSAIIAMISHMMGFMYWAVCFILCLVVLIIGLANGYSIPLETARSTDSFFTKLFAENPAFSWHCALLMLLIPRIDGYWDTYLNTEVTIYENGSANFNSWFSHEYTSGSAIKMGVIAVITLITAILYRISPLLAILPFVLEGGFCYFIGKASYKEFLIDN